MRCIILIKILIHGESIMNDTKNSWATKKLLSIAEILEILQIKRTTFYYLRKSGAFPAAISITGSQRNQRWRKEDVEEFIEAKRNLAAMQNNM